jgi:hypothetical protein
MGPKRCTLCFQFITINIYMFRAFILLNIRSHSIHINWYIFCAYYDGWLPESYWSYYASILRCTVNKTLTLIIMCFSWRGNSCVHIEAGSHADVWMKCSQYGLITRIRLIHFTVTFALLKLKNFDMIRASLAHREEVLHEHSFGGCSMLL